MARSYRTKSKNSPPTLAALIALAASSCVPAMADQRGGITIAVRDAVPEPAPYPAPAPEPLPVPEEGPALFGLDAAAANAALAIAGLPNPAAPPQVFAARAGLDRLRSLDCLAQAVYYEARSESEDGQRAVAQVVLNRVRHPAWPASVCGVVYQGPMRPGGGCQFTFTCDGSLAARPLGPGWDQARRIAADALAGRVFAPVGHSTHYHTHQVFPAWAPRLAKTAVIGSHNFYRLPGAGGAPSAFTARYSGIEPLPRPAVMAAFAAPQAPAPPPPLLHIEPRAAAPVPSDIAPDPRWVANDLPQSTVRKKYRRSGQWRADAPASIVGR